MFFCLGVMLDILFDGMEVGEIRDMKFEMV